LRDLRGGQTKVLLTSRRDEPWLGNIYRRLVLVGLKLVEAQELAVRVLKRAGLDPAQIRALPQYNDLLRYLHGNPLAIQVILPELKRTRPEVLLAALQKGEATFEADDSRQGRERSLSTSLTYRLDALEPALRKRLGILALFQGFVNADVLAAMSQRIEGSLELVQGMGREDWVHTMDAATEVGLLRRVGQGYYTIHPALPWFFHDLMREAFTDYIDWLEIGFSAVYGYYAFELSELFETNPEFSMNLLIAEEVNLFFALKKSISHELWMNIPGVLYGINQLLTIQGRWMEWKRVIFDIKSTIVDSHEEPLLGREGLYISLLGHLSEIARYTRDFDESKRLYLRLKEHFNNEGDEKNTAVILHQLGLIAQQQWQFEEAERWYYESLEIEKRIGDEHGQAITLHQLGTIAEQQRQFEEAESRYHQSLEIEKRIGVEHMKAGTLHQLGKIAMERSQFEEAERWSHQSLEIENRIGDEHGQASTLHQLGFIFQELGQLEAAEGWYRQSLEIKERIADEYGQAQTLHQMGLIAQQRRQFEEAERWYRQSLVIKERIGDWHAQAITLFQLGRNAQEQRQFEVAELWYHKGLEIEKRIGEKQLQAGTLHELGKIAWELRRIEEAERLFHQSLEMEKHIGEEHRRASTLHQLGLIADEQGNTERAIQLFRQSEELFIKVNDPFNLQIVQKSLKRLQGKLDASS
jgi:tetratricopeptide (TPR) repeat protein